MEGVLEFFSETGTEGGYWAFQDKKFITPNTTLFTCKKCHLIWDKESYSDDYLTKASADNIKFCAPDKHEFELTCPELHSYEGLHVLEDGDHLTIYSKENHEEMLWSGEISLKKHPLFTQHVFGLWIHADQEDMDREIWANYFLNHHPAKLIPFKINK